MSINLKDVVKSTIGFQGALQGAGTPNQAGIGGFLPLSVGDNSVWYLDALINVSFADRDGESSIINTDVDGGFSTSTRLGYRWLNDDRSWMVGLNAGYDSRTIESGYADTNIPVFDKQTIFFNQIAVNAEAVSNSWTFNGYGLIPFGDVEQRLNSFLTRVHSTPMAWMLAISLPQHCMPLLVTTTSTVIKKTSMVQVCAVALLTTSAKD